MKNKQLTYEITDHIISRLELIPDPNKGIINSNFKIKDLDLSEEDEVQKKVPVFFAKRKIFNFSFNIFVCFINDEIDIMFNLSETEYLFGIRSSAESKQIFLFLEKQWVPASISIQAKILANIEDISTIPSVWEAVKPDDTMSLKFSAFIETIEPDE